MAATLPYVACGRVDETNSAHRYGLTESYAYRDEVERAIILADIALARDVPFRFVATWQNARRYPEVRVTSTGARSVVYHSPSGEATRYEFQGYLPVPVYAVDGTADLGARETTFVPPDCRCVFINTRSLSAVLGGFGVVAPTATQRYSARERALAIALILLHEAGHVAAGHHGSYGGLAGDAMSTRPSATLQREVAADRFATTQIARALDARDVDRNEYLEGGRSGVANGLFRIVQTAWATHDQQPFLASNPDAARAQLYRATEPSHLNLQLRFEIMQYQLDPSEDRRRALRGLLGDVVDSAAFAPLRPPK